MIWLVDSRQAACFEFLWSRVNPDCLFDGVDGHKFAIFYYKEFVYAAEIRLGHAHMCILSGCGKSVARFCWELSSDGVIRGDVKVNLPAFISPFTLTPAAQCLTVKIPSVPIPTTASPSHDIHLPVSTLTFKRLSARRRNRSARGFALVYIFNCHTGRLVSLWWRTFV